MNCTRLISVDSLIFGDNVRTDACMQLPAMVDSIRRQGFKSNHPLVIHQTGEGEYHVLCGNRRGQALLWLRENEPDVFKKATQNGQVPCVIYKSLSPEQVVRLRLDHGSDEDRVPLCEYSLYAAIKQMTAIGVDVQKDIAIQLGLINTKGKNKGEPNRSYVQVRMNAARLPQFVEDELRKLCDDPGSTPFRWSHIAGLFKLQNAEFVEHPEGNGPEFQKRWVEIMNPEASTSSKSTAKALTPASAVKRAQAVTSAIVKRVLLSSTAQATESLAAVDVEAAGIEASAILLTAIAEYVGEGAFVELRRGALEILSTVAVEEPAVEEPAVDPEAAVDEVISDVVDHEAVTA